MRQDETPAKQKQPILRAPASVLVLIGLIVIIQALMATGGPSTTTSFLVEMALFPARFFAEGLGGLPGGLGQGIATLFTYSLLHGSWAHCLINVAFLLAFGAPVAKRLGARRFIYLYVLCVMLAGYGQVWITSFDGYLIPIIGASGGVAGMVGAAARFAFSQGVWGVSNEHQRLLSLRQVVTHRTVMMFILVWLGMNLIFGLLGPLGMATPDGSPANIAWVAHVVGFFSGLLLIGLFDKPPLSASGGPGNVDFGDWKDPK